MDTISIGMVEDIRVILRHTCVRTNTVSAVPRFCLLDAVAPCLEIFSKTKSRKAFFINFYVRGLNKDFSPLYK